MGRYVYIMSGFVVQNLILTGDISSCFLMFSKFIWITRQIAVQFEYSVSNNNNPVMLHFQWIKTGRWRNVKIFSDWLWVVLLSLLSLYFLSVSTLYTNDTYKKFICQKTNKYHTRKFVKTKDLRMNNHLSNKTNLRKEKFA